MSADFPPYVAGDDLIYAVTVRDARTRSFVPDASVYLIATPDRQPSHADSVHADHVAPAESRGGTFVFRPALTAEGTYRLVIVVDRAGNTALDPPVRVEHAVQLDRPMKHLPGGRSGVARGMPIATIGAAAMVVMVAMMLFVFR